MFPCPTHQHPYVLDSSSLKDIVSYILAACLNACLLVFRAGFRGSADIGKMSATNQPLITHTVNEDYYYSVCMTELEPDCPGTA